MTAEDKEHPAAGAPDEDEDVGYGKPPKRYRFNPGTSGNPHGRPKGSKNLATLIGEELDARLDVTEHGKRKSIKKKQVIAKRLVNKATAGDHKAIETILALEPTLPSGAQPNAPRGYELTADDEEVVREALASMRRSTASAAATKSEEREASDGDPTS